LWWFCDTADGYCARLTLAQRRFCVFVELTLGGCGGGNGVTETTSTTAHAAEPTPDPKDLVARLSDLPRGFTIDRKLTGPQTLEEVLSVQPKDREALYRRELSQYDAVFESPDKRGMECSAVVYRSSKRAQEIGHLSKE
jgi:hypothetical protein